LELRGLTKHMPELLQGRRRHAYLALAAALLFAVVLYRFPPGEYGFYPRCPVYALTGWECPGCGMTRALAAMVHGDFAGAIRFNALIVLMVPAAAIYMAVALRRGEWPNIPARVVQTLLIVAGLFAIARNVA
jgi:Protein of unknown function (DUF2752)